MNEEIPVALKAFVVAKPSLADEKLKILTLFPIKLAEIFKLWLYEVVPDVMLFIDPGLYMFLFPLLMLQT